MLPSYTNLHRVPTVLKVKQIWPLQDVQICSPCQPDHAPTLHCQANPTCQPAMLHWHCKFPTCCRAKLSPGKVATLQICQSHTAIGVEKQPRALVKPPQLTGQRLPSYTNLHRVPIAGLACKTDLATARCCKSAAPTNLTMLQHCTVKEIQHFKLANLPTLHWHCKCPTCCQAKLSPGKVATLQICQSPTLQAFRLKAKQPRALVKPPQVTGQTLPSYTNLHRVPTAGLGCSTDLATARCCKSAAPTNLTMLYLATFKSATLQAFRLKAKQATGQTTPSLAKDQSAGLACKTDLATARCCNLQPLPPWPCSNTALSCPCCTDTASFQLVVTWQGCNIANQPKSTLQALGLKATKSLVKPPQLTGQRPICRSCLQNRSGHCKMLQICSPYQPDYAPTLHCQGNLTLLQICQSPHSKLRLKATKSTGQTTPSHCQRLPSYTNLHRVPIAGLGCTEVATARCCKSAATLTMLHCPAHAACCTDTASFQFLPSKLSPDKVATFQLSLGAKQIWPLPAQLNLHKDPTAGLGRKQIWPLQSGNLQPLPTSPCSNTALASHFELANLPMLHWHCKFPTCCQAKMSPGKVANLVQHCKSGVESWPDGCPAHQSARVLTAALESKADLATARCSNLQLPTWPCSNTALSSKSNTLNLPTSMLHWHCKFLTFCQAKLSLAPICTEFNCRSWLQNRPGHARCANLQHLPFWLCLNTALPMLHWHYKFPTCCQAKLHLTRL